MSGLDPEYKEALLDWDRAGYACSCGHPNAHPPCSSCTHPGNATGLEVDECWTSVDARRALTEAYRSAEGFAMSKGFTPAGGHSSPLYAMAWYKGDKSLRYLFDVENERPVYSASQPGFYMCNYDTIQAAYVAAELAEWGTNKPPSYSDLKDMKLSFPNLLKDS